MGWSCAAEAGNTVRRISDIIVERHGNQNQWETPKGKFFFETSNTEHCDGAITGTVWRVHAPGTPIRGRVYAEDRLTKSGSFRIEADGSITRFPNLPTDIKKAVV